MKLHTHQSLLQRIITEIENDNDIYAIDLSPSDFHRVRGAVIREYYDHNRFASFGDGITEPVTSFELEGVTIQLVEDEPDA